MFLNCNIFHGKKTIKGHILININLKIFFKKNNIILLKKTFKRFNITKDFLTDFACQYKKNSKINTNHD